MGYLQAQAVAVARAELWRRGLLRFTLHPPQQKVYDRIAQTGVAKRYYLNISRRWGKSWLLLCLALEQCLQRPNSRVLYVAPFAKDAENIATDLLAKITVDCPSSLRPEYNGMRKELRFKNGSLIRFGGANNDRAQFARGLEIHLAIIDEAAIVDDLEYIIQSILMPMTLTTHGRILLASTPARSPGHASTIIAKQCRDEGAYAHYTIYDNPLITPEQIAQYMRESGGENTSTWRREYLADLDVVDADTAVLPEFDEQARQEMVREWARPEWFDGYVAMDPGMADRTGILFAYTDFINEKLIIEDELLLARAGTPQIAEGVKSKEFTLWGDRSPYARVTDVELRLQADLSNLHGLSFSLAQKHDSEGGINLVRYLVRTRKIIIHPRCTKLVQQMISATYNKAGTDFERTARDGHYDLVAALKYLCRAVNFQHNPIPDYVTRPFPSLTEQVRKAKRAQDRGLLPEGPLARRLLSQAKRPKAVRLRRGPPRV